MSIRMTRALSLIGLALALSCLGCSGSSDGRNFAEVKGTVKVKGNPIKGEGIVVSFSPDNGQAGVSVPVNPDGTYTGEAVVGNNRVTIVSYVPLETVGIQKKYTETDSPLTTNLEAGKENVVDLEVGQ